MNTIPDSAGAILCPSGDVVADSETELRRRLRELVASGVRKLTIDLSNVQMMDSAGLGLLIAAHNSLSKSGGELTVIHATHDLLELFRTMRMHQHFSISGE
ncbi:MAG: STAS domain-containing protein [Bryobacteraceae bacterium]